MKTRFLMSSLMVGSLLLASGTAVVFAGERGDCERGDRQQQRMEKRLAWMTQKLALTPEQQAAIEALWQQPSRSGGATMPRGWLRDLDPNAEDYPLQVQQQIEQAQRQLAQHLQARAERRAALYEILTPEQERQLEQMRKRSDHHQARAGSDKN